MVRAMRSGDPPGGSGITKRTGRLGKSWAAAGRKSDNNNSAVRVNTTPTLTLPLRGRGAVLKSTCLTLFAGGWRLAAGGWRLKGDVDVLRLRKRKQLVVALLPPDARLLVAT